MSAPAFPPQDTRRRIVGYMRAGREYLATELADRLGLPRRVVTRQLEVLRDMGIVRSSEIRNIDRPIHAWALESAQERPQGGKAGAAPEAQEGRSAGRKMGAA